MDRLEERVEKALHYLIDSSEQYARAKSEARSLAYLLKAVEAKEFIDSEGKTIRDKEMSARASEKYQHTIDKYKEAEYNSELLEARRETAKLLISYYQTRVKAEQRTL